MICVLNFLGILQRNWHGKSLMDPPVQGEVFQIQAHKYFTLCSLVQSDHTDFQFFRNIAKDLTAVISQECAPARLGILISSRKCTSPKSLGLWSYMFSISKECCTWIDIRNLRWTHQYQERYAPFKQKQCSVWGHLQSEDMYFEFFRNTAGELTWDISDGSASARWGVVTANKIVSMSLVTWSLIVHFLKLLGMLQINGPQ